jgi:hypothetical protein
VFCPIFRDRITPPAEQICSNDNLHNVSNHADAALYKDESGALETACIHRDKPRISRVRHFQSRLDSAILVQIASDLSQTTRRINAQKFGSGWFGELRDRSGMSVWIL